MYNIFRPKSGFANRNTSYSNQIRTRENKTRINCRTISMLAEPVGRLLTFIRAYLKPKIKAYVKGKERFLNRFYFENV